MLDLRDIFCRLLLTVQFYILDRLLYMLMYVWLTLVSVCEVTIPSHISMYFVPIYLHNKKFFYLLTPALLCFALRLVILSIYNSPQLLVDRLNYSEYLRKSTYWKKLKEDCKSILIYLPVIQVYSFYNFNFVALYLMAWFRFCLIFRTTWYR